MNLQQQCSKTKSDKIFDDTLLRPAPTQLGMADRYGYLNVNNTNAVSM